ncbi:MAG: PD-(D/E)XK nuclease family protein, partial [Planctomycetota bacterium]|nr:PD-(D/E)XK nuclease family protein [Planctomycetota bacterium]
VNVLRLVSQKIGQQEISTPQSCDAVKLLGWLELPLDVADSVIVTGFNEGVIPESLNADMFLPNSLRKAMQLTDNERRFARDAYAVCAMIHSKKNLRLIIGKRNSSGDPLAPSRIYFSTNREGIAERIREFSNPVNFVESFSPTETIQESQFFVPRPEVADLRIDSIGVTSFRTFLKCPYRFYLQHVLNLQAVHDRDCELNGMMFGSLLHEVFRSFGESRLCDCEQEAEIYDYLENELQQLVQRRFGRKRLPGIEIQIQQIRYRLQGFAQWQSKRTREGWKIRHVETKTVDPSGCDFGFEEGRSIKIKGVIDRIDFNECSNLWQILDYKTGDKAESPEKTHRVRGEWVDLQLPLYQHIAREMGVDGNVQLGYILVPKAMKETGESIARWSEDEIEEAISVARRCAQKIVDLEFWEPVHPAPLYAGQEFAAICQDNVFEPRLGQSPEENPVIVSGRES